MKKLNQPESGVLSSRPSSLLTNLGGAALLALTAGVAKEADAATWDTPVELSAINTTTAHEGYVAPDDSGSLLYISTTDGSNTTSKVLLSGASTPTDVSATGLSTYTGLSNFQPNSSSSFIASDSSTGAVVEVTDTSGGNYSSGSVTVLYDGVEDYDNVAYDRVSGEMAYVDSNGTDWDIYNLSDDSGLVTGSGDQFEPSLDSTHNRLFYTYNNSGTYEIWVKDLSGASLDQYVVDGLGAYYDQNNNRLYYAAVNGSTYDAYYMDEIVTATDPDEDGDGEAASVDCDDTNASINSSATEECDGVDNNCDGSVDGTDSIDVSTWYIDNDGDGVGGTSTQEACDQPDGYVATGGDWDDNDASVQTEPEPEECETESESGTYMPDQTICAPEAEGEVYEGAVAYYSDADTSELDSGDWLALVGQMGLDMSTYQDRYVFTPSTDFEGGFGLGISDDAMEARLHANMAPAAPPSEDGSAGVVTFYIDGGTLTVEDTVEGTTEVLHPQDDYYEYPVDLVEGGDTGDTGGDDTGPDDTGPDDTDDTAEVDDTDTNSGDSDTPDDTDTDGNGETPKDGGQGGCNSCASTPLPDASLAVFGLALAAGTMVRRRRQ